MQIISVDNPQNPELTDYLDIPDPLLLRKRGLFVAESRFVVRELLTHHTLRTRSLLVTTAALDSLRDLLDARPVDLPIYVGTQQFLKRIVGFNIHRGCLALGERPKRIPVNTLLQQPSTRLAVVLENVSNPDNLGSIFRNAAAFGVDCVLLSPHCCDPLYRKAIRTSIGATLRVPYTTIEHWPEGLHQLKDLGFTTIALTTEVHAEDIGNVLPKLLKRVALLFGSEGAGLSQSATVRTDTQARIPIAPEIDSLNVATASGIALFTISSFKRNQS